MYKLKCPACGDTHTVKNGKRKGVQTYVCRECGYQFRNNEKFSHDDLWRSYQNGKQTEWGEKANELRERWIEFIK